MNRMNGILKPLSLHSQILIIIPGKIEGLENIRRKSFAEIISNIECHKYCNIPLRERQDFLSTFCLVTEKLYLEKGKDLSSLRDRAA